MAVHAVRLDERHRGGDGAEQRLVGLRGAGGAARRRRGGRLGRTRGRRGVAVAAVPAGELEQPLQAGMTSDELLRAALEERRHSSGTASGILEVVLEQKPGVAGSSVRRPQAHSLVVL